MRIFALRHRQRDALIDLGIADDGFGILTLGHRFQIAQEALAQHQDAAVAGAQMLLGPIRNSSLPHPCNEVLIHHVARYQTAGGRIDHRAMPRRDALLHVEFALLRHPA